MTKEKSESGVDQEVGATRLINDKNRGSRIGESCPPAYRQMAILRGAFEQRGNISIVVSREAAPDARYLKVNPRTCEGVGDKVLDVDGDLVQCQRVSGRVRRRDGVSTTLNPNAAPPPRAPVSNSVPCCAGPVDAREVRPEYEHGRGIGLTLWAVCGSPVLVVD